MPPVSEAQRKWAWANKDKDTQEGHAAKEFAQADPGGKLPKKVKKKAVDRSAHWAGNPGFPSSEASGSPPPATYATHEKREKEVMGAGYEAHEYGPHENLSRKASHGFGHSVGQRSGSLRMSGHSGAHRIGKR